MKHLTILRYPRSGIRALTGIGLWNVLVGLLSLLDPADYLKWPSPFVWGLVQIVIGLGILSKVLRAKMGRPVKSNGNWMTAFFCYTMLRVSYLWLTFFLLGPSVALFSITAMRFMFWLPPLIGFPYLWWTTARKPLLESMMYSEELK